MGSNKPVCRRVFVSGRVQGVGFRYAAAGKARELGVTGHARNLPDGRVEVLACAPEPALSAFLEWLNEGPPLARVSVVSVEIVTDTNILEDFRIF